MKHPIQKVEIKDDVLRFVQNDIVHHMMQKLRLFGYDLNHLHEDCRNVDPDDWDQFNQLIGYSVSAIPLKNEHIHDSAQSLLKNGKLVGNDPNKVKEAIYEEKYETLKEQLRGPIAELYHIHPDDLT